MGCVVGKLQSKAEAEAQAAAQEYKRLIDKEDYEAALLFVTETNADVEIEFNLAENEFDSLPSRYSVLLYALEKSPVYRYSPDSDTEDYASTHKRAEQIIKLCLKLLEVGASVHKIGRTTSRYSTEFRITPLHLAARKNLFPVVQDLVERGADVDATFDNRHTPLLEACSGGGYESFIYLVKKGARLDMLDKDNKPQALLHLATSGGDLQIVQHLVEKTGISPNNRDARNTPLHWVQKPEIARYLLEKGAYVDAVEDIDGYFFRGNTALHTAAERGNTKLIKVLMEAGADKTIKNADGKTPLDLARDDDTIAAIRQSSAVTEGTPERRTALQHASLREIWECRVEQAVMIFKLNQPYVGPDFEDFARDSFKTWGFTGLVRHLQEKFGESCIPPAWTEQMDNGIELGMPPVDWNPR